MCQCGKILVPSFCLVKKFWSPLKLKPEFFAHTKGDQNFIGGRINQQTDAPRLGKNATIAPLNESLSQIGGQVGEPKEVVRLDIGSSPYFIVENLSK